MSKEKLKEEGGLHLEEALRSKTYKMSYEKSRTQKIIETILTFFVGYFFFLLLVVVTLMTLQLIGVVHIHSFCNLCVK